MAKAANKTTRTAAGVSDFIQRIPDEQTREECQVIIGLMQAATKEPPRMWGTSIVGFGSIHMRYASGRELDWMLCGFSPRKAALTIYLMDGYERRAELLARLGKHRLGKSCLYIRRLADVDLSVLEVLITESVKVVRTIEKPRKA